MHKKMTITLDEEVYEGLYRSVGKRKMIQFIEDLLRPYVLDGNLDAGYAAMAADSEREAEALSWSNFSLLIKPGKVMADQITAADKARLKGRIDSLPRTDMLAVEDALLIHLATRT